MNLEGIKVKSVEKQINKEDVYDINVADVHHYILENGVVTHNTMDLFPQDKMKGGEGLFYTASSIAFLTKAKLKDGTEDDLDIGQSGIIVTAKMMKNRMAKPKKVKFEISFVSGCNPFVGLDFWLTEETFDTVGVAKGKMVDDVFVAGGNRWYVKHLGKHVKTTELYTERVFTKEVLDALRPIIKDYFRYKSITEINEIEKQLLEAKGEIEEDEMFTEEMSTSNLFDEDEE